MARLPLFLAIVLAFGANAGLAGDAPKNGVVVMCRMRQGDEITQAPKVTGFSGDTLLVGFTEVSVEVTPTVEKDGMLTVEAKVMTEAGNPNPKETIVLPKLKLKAPRGQDVFFACGDLVEVTVSTDVVR